MIRNKFNVYIKIEKNALKMLADSSRGTARIGLRLLRRTRDYAQSRGEKVVDTEVVLETMKLLGERQGFLWQSVIVFLILLDGIMLFLALISNLKTVSLQFIGIIDLVVSVILLVSFVVVLIRSGDIKHNLIKNWPLIFSFIPIFFIVFAAGQERYIFNIKYLFFN